MKKTKWLFPKLLVSIISVAVFWWLESGFSARNGDELIKSVIFALSLFIILMSGYRKLILRTALSLLGVMVIFYLSGRIAFSSTVGSIGFGMLLIFMLGFLPDLIKKGFVEKL